MKNYIIFLVFILSFIILVSSCSAANVNETIILEETVNNKLHNENILTEDNSETIDDNFVTKQTDYTYQKETEKKENNCEKDNKTNLKSLCYPYSKLWLFRYAPSSVATLEEQVGDNGDYEDVYEYPPFDTYKLIVDYNNQTVWVLSKDENNKFTVMERAMICSSGGGVGWTPEGNYAMGEHRVRFGEFKNDNCFGQYWSNIVNRIYFHSLLYSSRSGSSWTKTSYKNLGKAVSHGCVRLYVPDARWVYYNCAPKTQVIVTTDIEKNQYLKDALKKGYECATDVLAEQDPDPFTYTKSIEKAHEYTWSQVMEIAETEYPETNAD